MTNNSVLSSKNYKFLLISLSIIGISIIYISTIRYGAVISSDSSNYIAIAENFAKGNGLFSFNGEPLLYFPPLYPILLSLSSIILGIDPLFISNGFNAIIFGLIIYVGGVFFLRQFLSSNIFALLGIFAIFSSYILFKSSIMALSEPLFILFVILSLFLFSKYISQNNLKLLVLLSISVSLATLTKYVGVTLIIWGALGILLFSSENLKRRISHSFVFSTISSIPICIWLMNNYIISETLTGPRSSSAFNLLPKLNDLFSTILNWYFHIRIVEHKGIFLIIILLLIIFITRSFVKSQYNLLNDIKEILPILLFIFIYIAFLIISTAKYSIEVDDRLLSPIYIPLMAVLLFFVKLLIKPYHNQFSNRFINIIIVISFMLWSVYPIRATVLHAKKLMQVGQGYNSKEWRENELICYLQQNNSLNTKTAIYSNEPYATYILTNLSTRITPYKSKDLTDFIGLWRSENNATIIWYNKIDYDVLLSLDEIKSLFYIDPIISFKDGGIYSVSLK